MKNKIVELLSALTTSSKEIKDDILVMNFTVVTACIVGSQNQFVLVDTGIENSGDYILKTIHRRFDKNAIPKAIVLTHAHFDHVGSVKKFIDMWNIPVYVHPQELPYVTGQKDYPVGDKSVSNGMVAKLSPSFPHTSINITNNVQPLPQDESIPFMPEWRWIHTPGHTEGHVSLYRERDGVLIVGDALTTTKQESLLSIITKREKISGPPQYLTSDWKAAEDSVKRLKDLNPSIVIPSHGKPMEGDKLKTHLEVLNNHFTEIAKPKHSNIDDRIQKRP